MENCNKCGKGISSFERYYHGQLAYCGVCYNHGLAMYLTFEAKPYKNPEGFGIVTKMQKVEAEPVKEPEPIITEDTLDEIIDPLTQADPVVSDLDITPQKPIEPPKLELPPAPKKQKETKTVTDAMKADCTPKALNTKKKPRQRQLPTEPPRRSSRIADKKNKKI